MASNLAWFRCRILVAISSSDEFLKKLSLAYPPRINVTEPHTLIIMSDKKLRNQLFCLAQQLHLFYRNLFSSIYSELEYLSSSLEDSWESSSIFLRKLWSKS